MWQYDKSLPSSIIVKKWPCLKPCSLKRSQDFFFSPNERFGNVKPIGWCGMIWGRSFIESKELAIVAQQEIHAMVKVWLWINVIIIVWELCIQWLKNKCSMTSDTPAYWTRPFWDRKLVRPKPCAPAGPEVSCPRMWQIMDEHRTSFNLYVNVCVLWKDSTSISVSLLCLRTTSPPCLHVAAWWPWGQGQCLGREHMWTHKRCQHQATTSQQSDTCQGSCADANKLKGQQRTKK